MELPESFKSRRVGERESAYDRTGRHVDLQITARCNHREAPTARITCGKCSRSIAVRITMSSITISTFAGVDFGGLIVS